MPSKRAAATRASAATEESASKKTKTTTATTATKKTAEKPAPKKAAATAKKGAATTTTKKTPTTKTATTKKAAAPKATPKAAATKKTAAPKKAAAPKKTPAPKKAAAPKKTARSTAESDKENETNPPQVNGTKRKREDEDEDKMQVDEQIAAEASTDAERASKRAKKEDETAAEAPKKRKAAAAPKPAPKRVARELKVINSAPTQVMDIFVFGEGTAGELGLGSARYDGKKPIDVKRPRINHNLKGIVQVACGGMHVAALTNDNKILTWGVNDQGALGRDTSWDGGLRDVADEDSDSDDDEDTGMNPKESTPAEIDTSAIPEDTTWVQLVASDSATFALTSTGQVYGWGTFRVSQLPPRTHISSLLTWECRATRVFSASTEPSWCSAPPSTCLSSPRSSALPPD